jgi:Protein of unknown function (DUF2892)
MENNMGAFDGYFRTLLFVLAVMFWVMTGQWVWMIPTGILFATAILSWCPIYAITGINTNKTA